MIPGLLAIAVLGSGPPELPKLPGEVPDTAEPEATEPEATEPESADPEATDPESVDPESSTPAEGPPAESTTESPPEPPQPETTSPAPTPAPAVACPCDELDWVCRQHNEAACSSDTSTTTSEPATTRPTTNFSGAPLSREDEDGSDAPEPTEARGLLVGLGLGLGGCRQDLCEINPVSLLVRGAMGYRFPFVSVVGNVMVGGGPKTDDDGGLLLVGFDAGIELFVASTERVDPYVGAGLGYMRVVETAVDMGTQPGGASSTQYYSRAALRVGGGIPVRLRSGWSMGPRFDYHWGFLGKLCQADVCVPVADFIEEAGEQSTIARRQLRQRFPRPWVLSLEFRRQF